MSVLFGIESDAPLFDSCLVSIGTVGSCVDEMHRPSIRTYSGTGTLNPEIAALVVCLAWWNEGLVSSSTILE